MTPITVGLYVLLPALIGAVIINLAAHFAASSKSQPLPRCPEGLHASEHIQRVCDRCGTTDLRLMWWATNELFNEINGSPVGALCASCFDYMATKRGELLLWRPEKFDENAYH